MEQNVSARLFAVVRSSCEPFSPSLVENLLEYTLKIWFRRKVKNAFGVRWGDKRFRSFLPLSSALSLAPMSTWSGFTISFFSACYRVLLFGARFSFFIITLLRLHEKGEAGAESRSVAGLFRYCSVLVILSFVNLWISSLHEQSSSKWEIIPIVFVSLIFSKTHPETFSSPSRKENNIKRRK